MGITKTKGVLRRLMLGAALGGSLAACAPQYANHGYMPPDDQLEQIVVGVDTRATVEQTIGSPATAGVINESGFYYVRSRKRTFGALAPREIEREVLAISFNSTGTVTNIETFGLERGQVVPLTRRVTTSGVRDNSFLRQLLGNIGSFAPAALGSR